MSTSNTPDPAPEELAPPDDFGASILAAMERRETGSTPTTSSDVPDDDAGPDFFGLKEWPGGTSVDAGVKPPEEPAAEEPAPEVEGEGEGETPAPAPAAGEPSTEEPSTEEPSTEEPSTEEPPASTASTVSTGYTWNDGTQEVTFDDAQVQNGLVLAAWAQNLPEPTRQAFAAIEAGQAAAVSAQEYEAFTAWRETRQREEAVNAPDLVDLDPEVASVIAELRGEVAALRGQTEQSTAPSTVDANLNATLARMDAAGTEYRSTHHLTDDEYNALYDTVVASETVPVISQQMAQFNPATGALVRPADPGEVFKRALDIALTQSPELLQQVQSRIASPPGASTSPESAGITDPGEAPVPSVASTTPSTPSTTSVQADTRLAAKKARASSVASAPSAAVAPPPRHVPLSSPETVSAMAKELAAVLGHE